MTERPREEPPAQAHDERTRDITLPSLPDRPAPALPRAWADLPPRPGDAAADPGPRPLPAWARGVEDGPTDQLAKPERRPRERTLAFDAPEMALRPARPVQVGRTPRRWPWLVLVLLVVAIIVGTGITLLVLLRAG